MKSFFAPARVAPAALAEPLEGRRLFAVSFLPIDYVNVPRRSEGLATGDFNNDGQVDLITSSQLEDRLGVFLNQGGTFVQQPLLQASNPRAVTVLDFNVDGKLDLALTTTQRADDDDGIHVFPGNGDGTFGPRVRYGLDRAGKELTSADINADGAPDIIVNAGEKIAVLLNNGDGTFARNVKYKGLDSRTRQIQIADMNSDGALDLVVATPKRSGITILFGQLTAPGTFAEPVVIPAGRDPVAVAVADFNSDGRIDIAAGNSGFRINGLSILRGNGDGTFQPPQKYDALNFSQTIVAGDFDGNGTADVMLGTAVGPFQIFTNDGAANFTLDSQVVGGGNARRGVEKTLAADFNLDGKIDLVSVVYRRSRLGVLLSGV